MVFRVQGKKLHLTYKGWFDHTKWIEWFTEMMGELKWWSIVNEEGHADGANVYQHCHVLVCTVKKMDFTNERKLDYLETHPHIKKVTTVEAVQNAWKYHEKDPVLLTRSKTSPIVSTQFYEDIINAPSLVEAIKLSGVEVKSVQDVRAIRNDRGVDQVVSPLLQEYSWTHQEPSSWNVLFVTGPTGVGKTRWALARFESPLLVSHLEDLKLFKSSRHDGIVFDDISLTGMSPTSCIHLVDSELPRTIRVLYGSVTLPAGIKKIFTSNESLQDVMPVMGSAHFAAIGRRITTMPVVSCMFSREAVIAPCTDAGECPTELNAPDATCVTGYPPMADGFTPPEVMEAGLDGSGIWDMEDMEAIGISMENSTPKRKRSQSK